MPNTNPSITGRLHDRLESYGGKEARATGRDKQYYEGYNDALEWVINNVLPNGEGTGHVAGKVPESGSNGRREYVTIGELFPQVGKRRCRVCMETVTPPKHVYCSDYCQTIAANVKKLYSWSFIKQLIAERDGECVRCGDTGEYNIDHIIPHANGGHPFDPDNLQRLCTDCHTEKGMTETDYRDDSNSGVRLFPGGTAGQLTMDSFEADPDAITESSDETGDHCTDCSELEYMQEQNTPNNDTSNPVKRGEEPSDDNE